MVNVLYNMCVSDRCWDRDVSAVRVVFCVCDCMTEEAELVCVSKSVFADENVSL